MPDHAPLHPITYADARPLIRNGDILLWKPTSLVGGLIASFTVAEYSHAAMAAWFENVLFQLESLQWYGGRAVTLSSQVARWPGRCDVYRVPGLHGRIAAEVAARRTGEPYGWKDFVHIISRKIAPWLCHHEMFTAPPGHPLVCSGLVADACRSVGKDPSPGEPVWSITPGMLGFPFSKYQFTLYATAAQVERVLDRGNCLRIAQAAGGVP